MNVQVSREPGSKKANESIPTPLRVNPNAHPKGNEPTRFVPPLVVGDEECACFRERVRLGRRERVAKRKQAALLYYGEREKITNIDSLLNSKQWARAYKALEGVRAVLLETQEEAGDETETGSAIVEL